MSRVPYPVAVLVGMRYMPYYALVSYCRLVKHAIRIAVHNSLGEAIWYFIKTIEMNRMSV